MYACLTNTLGFILVYAHLILESWCVIKYLKLHSAKGCMGPTSTPYRSGLWKPPAAPIRLPSHSPERALPAQTAEPSYDEFEADELAAAELYD